MGELETEATNKYSLQGTIKINGKDTKVTGLMNCCGYKTPPTGCPTDVKSVGYIQYIQNAKASCFALSDSSDKGETKWYLSTANPLEKKLTSNGVSFIGISDKSSEVPFNTTLEYFCDEDSPNPVFSLTGPHSTNNSLIIKIKTAKACGVFHDGPVPFLTSGRWLIFPFGLILGVYLLLFSSLKIRIALGLMGFAGAAFGGAATVYGIWPPKDDGGIGSSETLAAVGTAVLLGGLLAALIMFNKTVGRGICGFTFGMVLALEFYMYGVYRIEYNGVCVFLYCMLGGMGLLGTGLGLYFKEKIYLITSSFLGAYVLLKSVGIINSYYPNEFLVARFRYYNTKTTGKTSRGFVIVAQILGFLGFVFQVCILPKLFKKKPKEDEDEPKIEKLNPKDSIYSETGSYSNI